MILKKRNNLNFPLLLCKILDIWYKIIPYLKGALCIVGAMLLLLTVILLSSIYMYLIKT
jgi:hypothetical protein